MLGDVFTPESHAANATANRAMRIDFMRLTGRISDPAPLTLGMEQRGNRGVR